MYPTAKNLALHINWLSAMDPICAGMIVFCVRSYECWQRCHGVLRLLPAWDDRPNRRNAMALEIGFLVFPKLQQLDLTGPYEVFAALPGTRVHLIWKTLAPVISLSGLSVAPTVTMQDCPRLDVVCVCGGAGIDPLLEDEETLAFLRTVSARALHHLGLHWIPGACRGGPAGQQACRDTLDGARPAWSTWRQTAGGARGARRAHPHRWRRDSRHRLRANTGRGTRRHDRGGGDSTGA